MKGFVIVPMRKESVPAILNLAIDGGLSPWTAADYSAEIELAHSLTIQIEIDETKEIAGFLVMRLITDNDPNLYNQGDILNITVHRSFRRRGLASALIREATRYLSGYSPALLWLEVRAGNRPAIRFYEKHQFMKAYERKNFYSNPVEDAIVMKREV